MTNTQTELQRIDRHRMYLDTTYVYDGLDHTPIPLSRDYTLDEDGKMIKNNYRKKNGRN